MILPLRLPLIISHRIILVYLLSFTGPPDSKTRASVFRAILTNVKKDPSFNYAECSAVTDGYTPSDISALCSAAMNIPIQERTIAMKKSGHKNTMRQPELSGNTTSAGAGVSEPFPLRMLKVKVNLLPSLRVPPFFLFFSHFLVVLPILSAFVLFHHEKLRHLLPIRSLSPLPTSIIYSPRLLSLTLISSLPSPFPHLT